MEVDRKLLELDSQKVQENQEKKLKRKEFEQNEGKNNLKLLEMKMKKEYEKKAREHEEDKELVKRNLLNDMQKEFNYNNVMCNKKIEKNGFFLFKFIKIFY